MRQAERFLSLLAVALFVSLLSSARVASAEKALFVYTRSIVSRGDAEDEVLSQMTESGAIVERVEQQKKQVLLYQDVELKIDAGRQFPIQLNRKVLSCPLRVDSRDGLLLSFDFDKTPFRTLPPYYSPFVEIMLRSPVLMERNESGPIRVISIPTFVHSQHIDCLWAMQEKRFGEVAQMHGPMNAASENRDIVLGGVLDRRLRKDGSLTSAKNSIVMTVRKERFLRDMPEIPESGEIRRLLANSKVVLTIDETRICAATAAEAKDLLLSEPLQVRLRDRTR
jgi:hypothetical protein